MRCVSYVLMSMLAALPAAAMTIAEVDNPGAHPQDQLDNLGVIARQRVRDHKVSITANDGEAWQLEVQGLPGVTVEPASGTGPTIAVVRFSQPVETSVSGALVLKGSDGTEATRLDVVIHAWPNLGGSPTAEQLKLPSTWPRDPGYADQWAWWGFLPDNVSHPGKTIRGVDAWERTPCTQGGLHPDCTQDGQAGLAAGIRADKAWTVTTGQRSITLTILGSGINWADPDLREQVRLNADELNTCPPTGATMGDISTYDVNRDGWFNVRDYDDTELEDVNGNGVKDAQDLIFGSVGSHTCSNDTDDDGNGFRDDIAGWDFFSDDNDPSDSSDDGTGTRLANVAVAQGMNGVAGIGACPTCSFIPLRVGDGSQVDASPLAEAIVYSVDNMGSVVVAGVNALSRSAHMDHAIDYAHNSHVPVLAGSGDLGAGQPGWPAGSPHAFAVSALAPDTLSNRDGAGWEDASTFLNQNTCSNHGVKVVLAAPAADCSTGAAARVGGAVGLLLSLHNTLRRNDPSDPYRSRDLGSEEIHQLLILGSDDIDVPGAEVDPDALNLGKQRSNPGWDEHFGFGRVNVDRSLALLAAKRIPPEVEITSPTWNAFVPGTDGADVPVRARVQSLRTNAEINWRVRWGRGRAPSEAELDTHVVASGPLDGGRLQDVREFARIPVASVLASREPGETGTLDDGVITVEVSATIQAPGGAATARARRTFTVARDGSLHQPFPLRLESSGEASPKLADMDDDGRQDLVVITADGKLNVLTHRADPLPGFPVKLLVDDGECGGSVVRHTEQVGGLVNGAIAAKVASPIYGAPAVSRLDGDVHPPSIVVATTAGALFVVDQDGKPRKGFPVCIDQTHLSKDPVSPDDASRRLRRGRTFLSSPVIHDIDKDGEREIILMGGDGWLYAWHPDGKLQPGFPVELDNSARNSDPRSLDRVVSSVTVADLDGDERFEIVISSGERFGDAKRSLLYALKDDGQPFMAADAANTPVWPFPLDTLDVGHGQPVGVAAADLDGDKKDELIVAGSGGRVTVLTAAGRRSATPDMDTTGFGARSPAHDPSALPLWSEISMADLDGDGTLDVIHDAVGEHGTKVGQPGGRRMGFQHMVAAWDANSGKFKEGFPQLVADLQLRMDYPVADVDGDGNAEVVVATSGGLVHAFRKDGTQPTGWPKVTGGSMQAAPSLGDTDADGQIEMIAVSREGWLFQWDLQGPADSIQWAGFRHDVHNTGNAGITVPEREVIARECLCHDTGQTGRSNGPWFLLVLLLVGWRGQHRGRGSPYSG